MEKQFTVLDSDQLGRLIELHVDRAFRKMLHKEQDASPDLMTINQAAKFLNLAKQTIYGLTSRRQIPHFKKGRKIYFYKKELQLWVETGRQKSYPEAQSLKAKL